jgi:hypothetical protein
MTIVVGAAVFVADATEFYRLLNCRWVARADSTMLSNAAMAD